MMAVVYYNKMKSNKGRSDTEASEGSMEWISW